MRSRVTPNGMRTSMRNARMAMYPNPPPSLRRLTLILRNPQYRVITISRDGEDNLYAGSVTDALGNHHVIFSSNRLLQAMRQFVVLHTDGTFKVVPAGMGISQVNLDRHTSHCKLPYLSLLSVTQSLCCRFSVLWECGRTASYPSAGH